MRIFQPICWVLFFYLLTACGGGSVEPDASQNPDALLLDQGGDPPEVLVLPDVLSTETGSVVDEGIVPDPGEPTDQGQSQDQGTADLPGDSSDVEIVENDVPPAPTEPTILNYTASSDEHVQSLVNQAISGMGFNEESTQGPQIQDLYFAGHYYIAWIDQTGFVGKMNGFWRLNGKEGDALDFSVKNGPQAVNFFIVGEKGNGLFPAGYPGAEHTEVPNRTPEENDDPGCASGDWCNQYGHEEAASITNQDIPWWSACNEGQITWTTLFEPMSEQTIEGGVKLIWEAPLVKQADGDGLWDGDACNEDWLFPDGIRRSVYLQVGFELFANEMHFVRTLRFRNPAGNPEFDAPMGVVGGFVVTQWPNPHHMKQLDRWFRPTVSGFYDGYHSMDLVPDQWNDHNHPPADGDEVFGWIGNPFSLSAFASEVAGRTATISNVGEIDNDDVGVCLCRVHGAIEMGGGLLHSGSSLPISGDSLSVEARRMLELPGVPPEPVITQVYTYEAETDLLHATGAAVEDGWGANTLEHEAGYLIYGPYTTDWTGDVGTAEFTMMIDIVDSDDLEVVVIDVYDATAGEILNIQHITRTEFLAPFTYQTFGIDFSLLGMAGHEMEVRAFWKDISGIRIDKVTVISSN